MTAPFTFRIAKPSDCSDLAVLTDMASRRLASFLWGSEAAEGQSPFEVARDSIRTETDSPMYYENWHVAHRQDHILGGLNGHIIPPQSGHASQAKVPGVLKSLKELKAIAQGTWYLSSAAVFAEARGQGIGAAILAKAEGLARNAGCTRLTLIVGSFNAGAYRLYVRSGFEEWDRRDIMAFDGSDQTGSWILMVKDLT